MSAKSEDDHSQEEYNAQMEPEIILYEPDQEAKSGKGGDSDAPSDSDNSYSATPRKRTLRKKPRSQNYENNPFPIQYAIDTDDEVEEEDDDDDDDDDDDTAEWAKSIRETLYKNVPRKRKRGRPKGSKTIKPFKTARKSKPLEEEPEGTQKKGKCIFSDEEEFQLVQHVRRMEDIMYGITSQAIRLLAYELAHRLGLQHNFNHDRRMAGVDWCRGFMKRHPDIGSKRVDGPGGSGYTDAPSREAVDQFYDRLEKALKENQIPADRIFNVDESGIACVADGNKMFANRARRRIGRTSNVERGTVCTTICCMGATGSFVSPMIIFKRHKCGPGLMDGAPPNFVARKSHNGWMTEQLFLEWLQHFQKETRSSPTYKTLLISDHHSTHVTLQVHDFVEANGIVIVPVPPHSNHLVQPLDLNFFKPLQLNFQKEIQHWLNLHPGQTVEAEHLAGIFTAAYMKTIRVEMAVYAFRAAGVVPYNRDVYPKDGGPHVPPSYLLPATQTFPDYSMVGGGTYMDATYKLPHPHDNPFINENLVTAAAQHYKRVKYDFQQNSQIS